MAVVLFGAGLAGCRSDDSAIASDPLDKLDPAGNAAACVDLQGLSHCALGNARLTPSKDGSTLDVTAMRAPDKDGVAILLPEATEFDLAGTRRSDSGSTTITRAISAGVVTSTMTVQNTASGFTVSGTFTGNDASTYNVNLYKADTLVGTAAGLRSGVDGLTASWAQPQRIVIRIRIGFVVIIIVIGRAQPLAATEGACVWNLPLDDGQLAVTTLADGTAVTFDRLQLVENVQQGGSYPYLTFDRIDYTSNNPSLQITSESAQ
jgi:hypothetical protein